VRQADTSGAGRRALYRAQTILSSVEVTEQETREALVYMRQQAEEAVRYAKLAENQAKWRHSRMRTRSLEQAKRDLQEEEWKVAHL
jgi:hypothetical protein